MSTDDPFTRLLRLKYDLAKRCYPMPKDSELCFRVGMGFEAALLRDERFPEKAPALGSGDWTIFGVPVRRDYFNVPHDGARLEFSLDG